MLTRNLMRERGVVACIVAMAKAKAAPLGRSTSKGRRSRSRGEFRPSFASSAPSSKYRGRREGRVAAAPGALAQKTIARARKPQVQAGSHRPSLRDGLRLIRVLPGEPRVATVVLAKPLELSPRPWRLHGRARTTRLRRPRLCRTSIDTVTSTAFRTTFVTTRTSLSSAAERGQ
jgi:hypothetical protein